MVLLGKKKGKKNNVTNIQMLNWIYSNVLNLAMLMKVITKTKLLFPLRYPRNKQKEVSGSKIDIVVNS